MQKLRWMQVHEQSNGQLDGNLHAKVVHAKAGVSKF